MATASTKRSTSSPVRSNTEIRQLLLRYLYDRNANARSARSDKTGAAVKISVMRRDLKESHALSQSEVRSNLTYLISQGWVEEQNIEKAVPTPKGGVIPSTTVFYIITAPGIDKIEGPGEFTMDKFHGIRIEATGQNIITVGDGNQVNTQYEALGESLAELKDDIRGAEQLTDKHKVELIGDIDSIQSQLAKAAPNKSVIGTLWTGVTETAIKAGMLEKLAKSTEYLSSLIS